MIPYLQQCRADERTNRSDKETHCRLRWNKESTKGVRGRKHISDKRQNREGTDETYRRDENHKADRVVPASAYE